MMFYILYIIEYKEINLERTHWRKIDVPEEKYWKSMQKIYKNIKIHMTSNMKEKLLHTRKENELKRMNIQKTKETVSCGKGYSRTKKRIETASATRKTNGT